MMPKSGPCKDCAERFIACSDKCPKDARGEYGYQAWKAEYRKQQAAEKEYNLRRREDWMRSEEVEYEKQRQAKIKNGASGGMFYVRK